jgi:hypothetical protein
VPPQVAAVVPGDVLAGAATTRTFCTEVSAWLQRGVDGRLEGAGGPAPVAAVGGDDDLGLGVGDAGVQRLGGEPAEDDRVRAPIRAQASIAMTASGIIGR